MIRNFLLLAFVLLTQMGIAQMFQGPSSVTVGSTESYMFTNGSVFMSYSWSVDPSKGTVMSTSVSGTNYSANVKWIDGGSATLVFSGNGQNLGNKAITISCPSQAIPNTTFTYTTNTCGPKTITRTGTPPAGSQWCWQTSATGTGTGNCLSSFSVETTGTYYLRARCGTNWSAAKATAVVSVNFPNQPATPIISPNACGSKTLSKNGSPPSGVLWYWQGTNSSGTDFTSATAIANTFPVTTSGTYYIRARNTSGCWSTVTGIGVSIDNAAAPSPSSLTLDRKSVV